MCSVSCRRAHTQINWTSVQILPLCACPPLTSNPESFPSSTPIDPKPQTFFPAQPAALLPLTDGWNWLYGCFHGNVSVNSDWFLKSFAFIIPEEHRDWNKRQKTCMRCKNSVHYKDSEIEECFAVLFCFLGGSWCNDWETGRDLFKKVWISSFLQWLVCYCGIIYVFIINLQILLRFLVFFPDASRKIDFKYPYSCLLHNVYVVLWLISVLGVSRKAVWSWEIGLNG